MNKRLTFNKITRWIIFLIALLPIVSIFVVFSKLQFTADGSNSSGALIYGNPLSNFYMAISGVYNYLLHSVSNLPWYSSLMHILREAGFMGGNSDTMLINFAYAYFNYLFELMFLDLVFQCFTFFISLIRHAVEKLGGDF